MALFGFCGNFGDIDETVAWFRRHRLLHSLPPPCPNCGMDMTEVQSSRGTGDGLMWRCPTHKGCKQGIHQGSFFEQSRLELRVLAMLLYLWSLEVPVEVTTTLTSVSEHTVIQWFQYFRDACSWYFENFPEQIGGPGHVVQMDESVMVKRKYGRGRQAPERWVFGGYDTTSKKGFLRFVDWQMAAVLLPIIQEMVIPGTEIWTDEWRSYRGICNLPGGYGHGTVNHSQNFVDPITGVCTNSVEAYWMHAKRKFKNMSGTVEAMIPSHLDEFMFRDWMDLSVDRTQCFPTIIRVIAQWYLFILGMKQLCNSS